jgi:hypothetical protein
MNLEAIEQRALAYLEQIDNPLVRLDVLYAHLADHDLTDGFSVQQLKDFLTRHDQVRVIESPALELEDAAAAEPRGAYAVAKDRVPSQTQLTAMMREQLDVLMDALATAREEALQFDQPDKLRLIEEARERAQALRAKLAPDLPDNVVEFRQN